MFSEDQTPAMTGLPSQPDGLRKGFAPAPRQGQGRNSLRRGRWTHSLDLVMNGPSSFTGEESERRRVATFAEHRDCRSHTEISHHAHATIAELLD